MARFISRLARDRAGNTLMIVAFSLIPILAMIGGGIDMGRGYLSQSRLQQACDAGVLAARKKLGNTTVTGSAVPSNVQTVGDKFFNINFISGAYGTSSRAFTMTLESDRSISGAATVTVPTTLMRLFGYANLPVSATCTAQLNFSNTDVMMVLDVTGSMRDTNPGDTMPKIDVLKNTVKSFYASLEASKTAGTRIRYGFVPYSTNVNVGFLLKSNWMVDDWSYHGRVQKATGTTKLKQVWTTASAPISGSAVGNPNTISSTCPADTATWTVTNHTIAGDGTETWTYLVNGNDYDCGNAPENNFNVASTTYTNYIYTYSEKFAGTKMVPDYTWHYGLVPLDVSGFKGGGSNSTMAGGKISVDMGGSDPDDPEKFDAWMNGCVEERATYEITDYNNVDLTRALDLNIDLVPTSGNPDTQWRPALPDISWLHSLTWNNWSSWPWTAAGADSDEDFINAGWNGYAACPAQAQKLAEMTSSDVATYVDSLEAVGSTYHDIGMIWGGRLISPTGLFAAENADLGGKATNRNLIFLTDGATAPNELSYSSYGIEPLDKRRWSQSSTLTQTQVVENRFTVACNEVKKRNVTVWVISFGISMPTLLSSCAGPGHAFEASNSTQLNLAFSEIAKAMGDLRVAK